MSEQYDRSTADYLSELVQQLSAQTSTIDSLTNELARVTAQNVALLEACKFAHLASQTPDDTDWQKVRKRLSAAIDATESATTTQPVSDQARKAFSILSAIAYPRRGTVQEEMTIHIAADIIQALFTAEQLTDLSTQPPMTK